MSHAPQPRAQGGRAVARGFGGGPTSKAGEKRPGDEVEALRSRAGLQGFRSEIGYQIFDHVSKRVRKITDLRLK